MSEVKRYYPQGLEEHLKTEERAFVLASDYALLEAKAQAWERLAKERDIMLDCYDDGDDEKYIMAMGRESEAMADLRALGVEL